jgi:hypothetical protein
MSGAGSTLIIHPIGLSDVTMDVDCDGHYIVPIQYLDLNEHLRRQVAYGSFARGEGGEAVSDKSPLVPLTWRVILKASTKADLIAYYNTLQAALFQGGTVEYKPEGVGAGVLSTFFHYVKSGPPKRIAKFNNRWDGDALSDNQFRMYVEVEFQTQPIATSDPDNPATLLEMSATLDNWIDNSPAQGNSLTITAANIKGSIPALVRITAQPGNKYLGRLIAFKRESIVSTLANVSPILEAEDATEEDIYWGWIEDSDRGDGKYMRCKPPSSLNGVAQPLRFTLSNADEYEGRVAVFGIGYDDAYETGIWTHQVRFRAGNVVQSGRSDHYASQLHMWCLIYGGEFELPLVPFSDLETNYGLGPYIEWRSSRASGSGEFRLDALLLVFIADKFWKPAALDVPCDDHDETWDSWGIDTDEKLLIESFPGEQSPICELAHVIVASDNDFRRALLTAPRGDFITLDPSCDTKLFFIQERASGYTILDDDFESYEDLYWTEIDTFEDKNDWSSGDSHDDDTSKYVEDSQGIKHTVDPGGTDLLEQTGKGIDILDRYPSLSCLCCAAYAHDDHLDAITQRLGPDDSHYFYYQHTGLSIGWNFLHPAKSDFVSSGGDWGDCDYIAMLTDADASGTDVTYDHWRLEISYSGDPNATGEQWLFQPTAGVWTITKDVNGATLACLDIESGIEKEAIIDETTPDDIQLRAKVMAKRDEGYIGILWRSNTKTPSEGLEDMYAAVLDTANNKVLVREYTNGSATQHDNPSFSCAVDTWYTIGVIVKGSEFRIFATASSNLTDQDDIFSSDYLLSTVTDSTIASGYCGVLSISTLGRFDDVKLVSLQDKVIPADQITLEGKAIFRTIAPFGE